MSDVTSTNRNPLSLPEKLVDTGDAHFAPRAAVVSPPPTAATATIANGASLSGAVNLGAMRPGRLVVPAAWTAAAISFDVSADGVTYGPLFDQYGTEVSISAGAALASRQIVLDPQLFQSVNFLKVRSGLSGAVVVQGGSRDIGVVGV